MSEERLQKILARVGLGSRRSCEELIEQGRVIVNGKKAIIGQKADVAVDKITVDGTPIPQIKDFRYIVLNKPRFVLCDKVEGDNRRIVFDMIEDGHELSVVGRLDFESEGLVLLTNDGELLNKLTHPRFQHEKEYRVLVATHPDDKQLGIWRRGVVLEDGHRTSPAKVQMDKDSGKGSWIRVTLKEGHKRQIREMAKLTGLFVVKLVRVRIGTLNLGSLKSGEYRNLTDEEVMRLRSLTDQPKSVDRKAQSKPVDRKTQSKPVDRKVQSKTVDRKDQSKPMDRKARSKPVDRKTQSKPVDRKDQSKPVDHKVRSKPVVRKVRSNQ